FSNKLQADKIIEYAKAQLTSNIVDKEAWIKPILILIEYDLTDQSNPIFISLNRDLHLEHILPKKYKNFKEWDHITDEIKNKWLHSIANLTLLSDKTSNTTAFPLSQKVLNDFYQKTFNQQWNEEALHNRYLWMLNKLDQLLALDSFSEEQMTSTQMDNHNS
ncbi:GmrSD restriction endonuclease domain-containing protein, partial [Gilliamella sp. wkB171]|uniref:GmrSD restriction endonuclease domain-containing protein n=1 Tax=Gilliamella sp. wkB171 TaxID=3120258 RepID=UPI00117A088D